MLSEYDGASIVDSSAGPCDDSEFASRMANLSRSLSVSLATVPGRAQLGERIQARERGGAGDAELVRIGEQLGERDGQRRQRADAAVGKQLRLQRRTEPRIVVEQAVHVLEHGFAHVAVREPGEPAQSAALEIVRQRRRDVGDHRSPTPSQLVDVADAEVGAQLSRRDVRSISASDVGLAVRPAQLQRSVSRLDVDQPGVERRIAR